jgi:hypothetical protein
MEKWEDMAETILSYLLAEESSNPQRISKKMGVWESGEDGKTQIWIAVSVYVLAAIIKKQLALEISLYTFLQILSVRPFEKIPISSAFFDLDDSLSIPATSNQLNLFNN